MPHTVTAALALVVTLALASAAFAEAINPYPRALVSAEKVVEWTFDAGTAGWTAAHDAKVAAEGGTLAITCTGDDPYIHSPDLAAKGIAGPVEVRLRMKCAAASAGQIFWATDAGNFAEERSAHFDLNHDGQWHDYAVALDAKGKLARLRLDPGSAPGRVEVQRIEVARLQWHPLEIVEVVQADGQVHADIRNHSAEAIEAVARPIYASPQNQDKPLPREIPLKIEAGKTARVTFPAPNGKVFDSVKLVVEAKGLPAVARTVFCYNADVVSEGSLGWASGQGSDTLSVIIAGDGSGMSLGANKGAVVIWPLVHRDGVVPRMTPTKTDDPSIYRFSGDGVTVTIRNTVPGGLPLRGTEFSIEIQSDKPVEGPCVRAVGPPQSGLFAGLEYLGKGEASSSTLDIETPEHVRFAPNRLMVTMPLMACVTDRAAVAVTWTDMSNQPVYASPNFFDGTPDHRMALRGTHIKATIFVGHPDPAVAGGGIEETILWAVNKQRLPPLPFPAALRTDDEQAKLAISALAGPLKGPAGWGHCAEASWPRQPYADQASMIWRLTGEAPDLPRIAGGGAHVRNDAIWFVTGRAAEWLKWRAGQAASLIKEQQPDGSFVYAGKYERGHYEKTASGYCATKAALLLEHARLTGDVAARDAGLKTLDYMKRFDVPRGAQVWELSLHTPDILASAYLVWAYTRGYELTGKKEYLAEARRWALSGVPFVYLWGEKPVMPYATIAVYGATNWQAPNWMGLPVQWCGNVYAYALVMLAPYDQTLDWAKLARGILLAGEQMEAPTGPYAGCLPDSFALATQERRGPFINPCGLMSLRLALDGKLDSLAVASDASHRIVSPFPVKIDGAKAVIEGKKGVAYQVVIDGRRVVDVKSEGTDTVPLE